MADRIPMVKKEGGLIGYIKDPGGFILRIVEEPHPIEDFPIDIKNHTVKDIAIKYHDIGTRGTCRTHIDGPLVDCFVIDPKHYERAIKLLEDQ